MGVKDEGERGRYLISVLVGVKDEGERGRYLSFIKLMQKIKKVMLQLRLGEVL